MIQNVLLKVYFLFLKRFLTHFNNTTHTNDKHVYNEYSDSKQQFVDHTKCCRIRGLNPQHSLLQEVARFSLQPISIPPIYYNCVYVYTLVYSFGHHGQSSLL